MARNLGGFLVLFLAISICEAASIFQPISDSHRSAALELFSPTDGSFGRSIQPLINPSFFDFLFRFVLSFQISMALCLVAEKSSRNGEKTEFQICRVNLNLNWKGFRILVTKNVRFLGQFWTLSFVSGWFEFSDLIWLKKWREYGIWRVVNLCLGSWDCINKMYDLKLY